MGIDTVALEGKGFKRLVEEGAQVSAGQPILEMDLDYLNANARSMISPVVCSNIDDFSGLIIESSRAMLWRVKHRCMKSKVICFMPDATLERRIQQ